MAIGLTLDALGSKNSLTDAKDMEKYIQDVFKKRDAILAKIKEEQDNQINYTDLIEMFEKIDKNMRIDNMGGY
jgi:hypothetical protein